MPRGWDQRFDDPAEEEVDAEALNERETESEPEPATEQSASSSDDEVDSEPSSNPDQKDELNIRKDWVGNTIYIEPMQDENLDVEFTRLKKRLKREEGIRVEKSKHFFRGIFSVCLNEGHEEVIAEIKRLAHEDEE
jgi:hypothetical protein